MRHSLAEKARWLDSQNAPAQLQITDQRHDALK